MATTWAIIPSRYASTRFPGKPLADETGMTLVQHVWERTRLASSIQRVAIATDDERIAGAVRAFGGEVVLTREDHPNGSSRLDEACTTLGVEDDAIVANVQGDEPEIEPGLIDACVNALRDSEAPVSTIAAPFEAGEDPADPHIVKVVLDSKSRALYFSRARIPHAVSEDVAAPLKHVGLYCYRRGFLRRYVAEQPTPLERTERLEQLRVLEMGLPIQVAVHSAAGRGIDTPEDYRAFVARWNSAHADA